MTRNQTACLAIVLSLISSDVLAQSRTYYDSSGKVSGRSTTDSAGATTFYDASGRVTGRSSINSSGTATFYDASGRQTGSVTGPKPQKGK